MKELQTDYLDYYLLHSVGGGEGIKTFHDRYIDNGVLDFLLKEREEGRIRNLGWSFHGSVEVFDYLLSLDVNGICANSDELCRLAPCFGSKC